MGEKKEVEKSYSNNEAAIELRRLADALEKEKPYAIEIEGERIYIPASAILKFEYERDEEQEELEIELKWKSH